MPHTTSAPTRRRSASTNLVLTVLVLVVATAIIGGVLFVNSGKQNTPASLPKELLVTPDSHTLSTAPDGKATLVEFFDFQCPGCVAHYEAVTSKLEEEYRGRITFVTRSFPLNGHPLGQPAAQAAEAAGLQGQYPAMYHQLFQHAREWAANPDGSLSDDVPKARETFERYAADLHLDVARFSRDFDSPRVAERIRRDRSDGDRTGLSGTPAFFINGTEFQPDLHGKSIEEVLDLYRGALDDALAA